MTSHLIWIPSKQIYHRFSELTLLQQIELSAAANINEVEFNWHYMTLIESLILDEGVDVRGFTVIDKYVIGCFLRGKSVGMMLELSTQCDKCNKDISKALNIDDLITKVASRIDKQFEGEIVSGDYVFRCKLPTMASEYETSVKNAHDNLNRKQQAVENMVVNDLMNHIDEIFLNGQSLNFRSFGFAEKTMIIEEIPTAAISKVEKEFLLPIREMTASSNLFNIACKECAEESTSLDFSITRINELLKLMFGVDMRHMSDLLASIASAGMQPDHILGLPPYRLDLYVDSFRKLNSEDQEGEGDQTLEEFKDVSPDLQRSLETGDYSDVIQPSGEFKGFGGE